MQPASCLQKAKGELSPTWVNVYGKVLMLQAAMVLNIVLTCICIYNNLSMLIKLMY